jgi:hypothetical protein
MAYPPPISSAGLCLEVHGSRRAGAVLLAGGEKKKMVEERERKVSIPTYACVDRVCRFSNLKLEEDVTIVWP